MGAALQLLQLRPRGRPRARLAQHLGVERKDLIGANHPGTRQVLGNGQRLAVCQELGGIARAGDSAPQRGFVEVGRLGREGDAGSVQEARTGGAAARQDDGDVFPRCQRITCSGICPMALQLPLLHAVELPSPTHHTGERFCPPLPRSGDNSCSFVHPSDIVATLPARPLCTDCLATTIPAPETTNHHYHLYLIPYDY